MSQIKLENVPNVITLLTRIMNASPNLAATTLLFFLYNGRTISFGKERPPANFSFKNRTASAQAYDLTAETFETCAKEGMALRVTRNRHMF